MQDKRRHLNNQSKTPAIAAEDKTSDSEEEK